jgi:hypothetical protein
LGGIPAGTSKVRLVESIEEQIIIINHHHHHRIWNLPPPALM